MKYYLFRLESWISCAGSFSLTGGDVQNVAPHTLPALFLCLSVLSSVQFCGFRHVLFMSAVFFISVTLQTEAHSDLCIICKCVDTVQLPKIFFYFFIFFH